MNKIKEIILSYATAMNPTEEQKQIAEKRLEVCFSCEHIRNTPERCGLCGCILRGKVFTPNGSSSCPSNKWTI